MVNSLAYLLALMALPCLGAPVPEPGSGQDFTLVEAVRELRAVTADFKEQGGWRGIPPCLIEIRVWRASTIPESQVSGPRAIIGNALLRAQKLYARRGIHLSFLNAGPLPEKIDGKATGTILRDSSYARGLLADHATIGDLERFVASTEASPSLVFVSSIAGQGNPAGVASPSRNTAAAERPWGSDVVSHELGHVFGLEDEDMVRGGDRFLPGDRAWLAMLNNCRNRKAAAEK